MRPEIIAVSPKSKETLAQAREVAPFDVSVLIEGETGTGKELYATAIHEWSARCSRDLVPVNCAAVTDALAEADLFGHTKGSFTGADCERDGRFQLANRSTLFLDEIGDMKASVQPKVLRALESGEVWPVGSQKPLRVDVRVVAATNHDVDALVRDNRLRSDLLYRIAEERIRLAPLRERREDIRPLAEDFLVHAARKYRKNVTSITEEAFDVLERYSWPGNARELKLVVGRLVRRCDTRRISVRDLPEHITVGALEHVQRGILEVQDGETGKHAILGVTRNVYEWALQVCRGSPTEAARLLRVSRSTFYRRARQFGLLDKRRQAHETGT